LSKLIFLNLIFNNLFHIYNNPNIRKFHIVLDEFSLQATTKIDTIEGFEAITSIEDTTPTTQGTQRNAIHEAQETGF
jgi:hypothetical protein